ncbi:hypothetical protein J2TS6_55510 [Paenibacillus albilobatus]|uniref:Uncharacterized protein n=1 Tax=Paenibacillus albilobatus TaxID=2716884 RepID=A0A919XP87_9BACL|nr:hypothetical protein J2TS6_55510 [Paenibacillus albilobatus]
MNDRKITKRRIVDIWIQRQGMKTRSGAQVMYGGERQMTGRNNKPKNDGPASSPGRLDQFGEKLTEVDGNKPMNPGKNGGKSC